MRRDTKCRDATACGRLASTVHGTRIDRRITVSVDSSANDGTWRVRRTHLEETDSGSFLTEALTAEVKTVLADETGLVSAETAEKKATTFSAVHEVSPP